MCGIAGFWGSTELLNVDRLGRLVGDGLAHRGPDGEGFLSIPADPAGSPRTCKRRELQAQPALRGLLSHRRLSIIDLATGDQPMGTADAKFWIVYNGEIYNYRELRRELERLERGGCKTHSDTEVVLLAYRHWGLEGLQRLNGIFAFAILDTERREIVLARDPIGVKPLYYLQHAGGLAFSSEVRPLLATGFVQPDVSPTHLAQFLFYRFTPAPGTLWKNIHKVTPGHALRFDGDGRQTENVDFAAPPAKPRHWSGRGGADFLVGPFVKAVRGQMLSDVPVGAFLSGGLDSSLVVSAMGKDAEQLPSFAIGFADEGEGTSELLVARTAAAVLGTSHEEREVDAAGYFSRLPAAIVQAEEPLAHPGMLLQSDLSLLARGRVKVVLTGQGADEPLGGYPRHHAARVLPLLAAALAVPARTQIAARWSARRETLARVRNVLAAAPGLERTAALFSPISADDAAAMVRGNASSVSREAILSGIAGWWRRAEGLDDVARALYVDVRTSLSDDLLLVADRMSMAHSLEARVPYLDLEYLSLIESLPGATRVPLWGRRKALQHKLGAKLLPRTLTASLAGSSSPLRRKRGFDVPVARWFRGPFRHALREYVSGSGSMLPSYVCEQALRTGVDSFLQGRGQAYRQVLSFYVLETWLRAFIGNGSVQTGQA